MYVTDKYVFIHCQKTGGLFVKYWMYKYLGARLHIYKHVPIRCLGEKHKHKTIIGIVRNPFDWYVSYWVYMRKYRKISTGFEEFLHTYTEQPLKLMELMREKYPGLYPPSPKEPIGAWTFFLTNYYGKGIQLDVIFRTENLQEDMIKLFGEEHRESILEFPVNNKMRHKHYSKYYTPELRLLVESKDGELMQYLNYRYEEELCLKRK